VRTAAGEIGAHLPGAVTIQKREVTLSIRPEQIEVAADEHGGSRNRLRGQVVESTFLGESSEHVVDVGGERLRLVATPPRFDVPESLDIAFDYDDVVLLSQ
jgi:ABC-type Fe3+/spermidine/putrescine transport system ATPase subunit